jgi:hypothetical protein
MFGFEGLGCIYWHMVSKLLLAIQEQYFDALDGDEEPAIVGRLGALYYRVRAGLGFNKTPVEYGAFPADPYSHTPGHSGAQQPGMTGQVKEEVLTRFGELGLRVRDGEVHFDPRLLRECEFLARPASLRYLDVDGEWQTLAVPGHALAFTWCQVPIVYGLHDVPETLLTVTRDDGEVMSFVQSSLPKALSAEIAGRSGRIRQIGLTFPRRGLLPPSWA